MASLLMAAAAPSATLSAESRRRITFSPKRNCRNRAQQPERPLLACPPSRSHPPRCTAAAGVAPGRILHTTRPGPVPQPPLTFPQRPRLRLQPPVTLGARFYSFAHRLRGGRMPAGQPGWGGSPRGGDGRGTAPPAGAGARR